MFWLSSVRHTGMWYYTTEVNFRVYLKANGTVGEFLLELENLPYHQSVLAKDFLQILEQKSAYLQEQLVQLPWPLLRNWHCDQNTPYS